MSWIEFLKTKQAWRQILYICLVFIGILCLSYISLSFFTRHGQSILVPDFRGRTLDELKEVSKQYHFKFEVRDSVYDPERKAGTIVNYSPQEGLTVKKGRIFYVVTAAYNPTKVRMPNLIDLSYRQAISLLETYGLRVGELRYVPSMAKNAIIEQYYKGRVIEPGEEISKGSTIDLSVGGQEIGESASFDQEAALKENIEENSEVYEEESF